jgi:hypothetical protein
MVQPSPPLGLLVKLSLTEALPLYPPVESYWTYPVITDVQEVLTPRADGLKSPLEKGAQRKGLAGVFVPKPLPEIVTAQLLIKFPEILEILGAAKAKKGKRQNRKTAGAKNIKLFSFEL